MQDQTKPQAPWLPDNIATLTSGVVPRVLFICGGDLLESFSVPGLWLEEDVMIKIDSFFRLFLIFVASR